MKKDNSGKVYQFELKHNLGFAYCIFYDYTDVTKFNGKLISVFKYLGEDSINYEIKKIADSGFLFGPHPLLKFPNIKGKGAWKFIGKLDDYSEPEIRFKNVRDNFTKKDWPKLSGWHEIVNFDIIGEDCNYEQVRNLELPTLYGMREIELRTTFQNMLMNNLSITEYYDLADMHLRNIYIQTVNTSFSMKEATEFLKKIN